MDSTLTVSARSRHRATPEKLFGYDILQHLGDGAGSRIYAVTHGTANQVYALKHVVRTNDKSVRFIEQLENEYAVARQVRHPNLRGVVDMHYQRTLLRRVTEAALVMELVDATPLDIHQPTRVSDVLSTFIQTAHGLQAMHDAGYIHCDLKPANILVSHDYKMAKVIDLGQACRTGVATERIQGTPDYISPEQVKCRPVTPQTDIYNFGAALYWTLTGTKLPTLFTLKKGENSFLVDTHIKTPAELNPLVSEPLSNFVMECVRVNPTKRPASMKVVSDRLDFFRDIARRDEQARRASVA